MGKEYLPRIFDEILDSSLKSLGVVLVVGPKWCGETTICLKHAKLLLICCLLNQENKIFNLPKVII